MAGGKLRLFGQRDKFVFRPQGIVRHFTACQTGIGKQRGYTALNVHPAVTASRSGLVGNVIQRFFMSQQVFGHRLHHLCALLEGHLRQRLATPAARILQAGGQRQPIGTNLIQRFAGNGMMDFAGSALAEHPAARKVTV
ncbi:hypothetical protein D3C78_1023920 [compost metagenome]